MRDWRSRSKPGYGAYARLVVARPLPIGSDVSSPLSDTERLTKRLRTFAATESPVLPTYRWPLLVAAVDRFQAAGAVIVRLEGSRRLFVDRPT